MSRTSDTIGTTISQHIAFEQREYSPNASGNFSNLLSEIIVAAKVVRNHVTLAGIVETIGSTGVQNVQGESQQILDELADKLMVKRLLSCGAIAMIISEENENIIYPDPKYRGDYIVAIDPLDGSSNIACNIPVGTIFGIWKYDESLGDNQIEQMTGRNQVAAGYILYGPSCMLVYSTGHGVNGFTLDPSVGEFILTYPNMKLPPYSKNFSVNEAYYYKWDKEVQDIVTWMKIPDPEKHRPYGGRYVGSLVADFHRNLLYGGIYLYPAERGKTTGKLRLLYEANPLAFLIEQAGGSASDGHESIMNIKPTGLHQRVSLYIGNKEDVIACCEFLSGKRKLEIK